MFGSKPKFTPGVPYEVQRVYNMLNPKPKELLQRAGERTFVNEGEVGIFNNKERRTKRRYLFLFNDVLLVTKKEGKRSFWLKVYISLRSPNVKIEDVPDSATKYKVEFRLYAPKKTIILFTQTEEQKLRWLKEIGQCIENQNAGDNVPTPAPSQDSNAFGEAVPVIPQVERKQEEPAPASEESEKAAPAEVPEEPEDTHVCEDYGVIPTAAEDESSEEEGGTAPEMITQPKLDTRYEDLPLPPTPSSTPVETMLGSEFTPVSYGDFDPNITSQPQSYGDIAAPAPAAQPAFVVPNPPDVFDPNLSIEEQMRRLSMQAPTFQGN